MFRGRNDALEFLGLPPNATYENARKVYKKMAMRLHPNRGGSEEAFQRLGNALNVIERTKNNNNKNKFFSASNKNTNRLRSVIKSSMRYVFRRSNTVKNRIAFSKKLISYFEKIGLKRNCMQKVGKTLALVDADGHPVVVFDKNNRIGSKSAYGVAHLQRGRGVYVPFKFASKITALDEGCLTELEMLRGMTELVMLGFTPNLPIVYSASACRMPCAFPECPDVIRGKEYVAILSELADMDLNKWFAGRRTDEEYQSIIVQIILAVYAFQQLGSVHRDTHLGNFLVHNVTREGYWRYSIQNPKDPNAPFEFYLKNCGHLLVLWDPGLAGVWRHPEWTRDFSRPMNLIKSIGTSRTYAAMNMKPIPPRIWDHVMTLMGILGRYKKYPASEDNVYPLDLFMYDAANLFSIWFPKVVTQGTKHVSAKNGRVRYTAPENDILLNVRPYLDLKNLPNKI
jgi:hypothetical protein